MAIKQLRGAPSHNRELHEETKKACLCLLLLLLRDLKAHQKLNKHGLLWIKLNNVNVLRFQGILYNFGYLPALVTTYCDNGNVFEFLSKTDRKIERILFIVSDIALRFFLSQAVDL